MAQRVGIGVALLFHDRGTRRGLVVSSTPRPHFTPGKDPVPILQEAGWAPGPVWTGGKSRPHRDSISGPSSPQSVAIPTELPAHTLDLYIMKLKQHSKDVQGVTLLVCSISCRPSKCSVYFNNSYLCSTGLELILFDFYVSVGNCSFCLNS